MPRADPTRLQFRNTLGYFGVLCICCLLLLTLINLVAADLLDPDWFDSLAFWRGTTYRHESFDPALLQPTPPAPAPTFADAGADPFAGHWGGTVYLKNGSLAAPLNGLVDYCLVRMGAEGDSPMGAPKISALRPLLQQIQSAAIAGEFFIRVVGIHVEFIVRKDPQNPGAYTLQLTQVAVLDTSLLPSIPLRRVTPHTLGLPLPYAQLGVPPLLLRLHRQGEIRDIYNIDDLIGSNRIYCVLHWNFHPMTDPAPAPGSAPAPASTAAAPG